MKLHTLADSCESMMCLIDFGVKRTKSRSGVLIIENGFRAITDNVI